MSGSDLRVFLIFIFLCAALIFFFPNEAKRLADATFGEEFFSSADVPDDEALASIYKRLKIKPIPSRLLSNKKIAESLTELSDAPCDKRAIFKLGNQLAGQNKRRLAANVFLGFSRTCANSEGELRVAANLLYDLGDYEAVLPLADELVSRRPEIGQYYYLRAQTFSSLGQHLNAVGDFSSAIGALDDLKRVNTKVFMQLARSYAELSKFCQAMNTLQTFVYVEPEKRDTSAMRMLISRYADKGNCKTGYAQGTTSLPLPRKGVKLVRVEVNGVKGRFILDTGASVVAVSPEFANIAKVSSQKSRPIMVQTANGLAEAKLTTARSVKLGNAKAESVSLAVLSSSLGPKIDGLLGMSFLARFDVTFGEKTVVLKARKLSSAK